MSLSEKINFYSMQVGFKSKHLAKASGISEASISAYRKGISVPRLNSKRLVQLADGICRLALEKGMEIDREEVLSELVHSVNKEVTVSLDNYIQNLVSLLKTLDMTYGRFAKLMGYNISQISRIISGKSIPNDIDKFTESAASCISSDYSDPVYYPSLANLFHCDQSDIDTPEKLKRTTIAWIGTNKAVPQKNPIDGFLDKIDDFDLNDFIQAMTFASSSMPSMPELPEGTSYYHGEEEFKKCEIDFINASLMSQAKDEIIIYSDMPIYEMASDEVFAKQYMTGLVMLLKNGAHINFIHDVHRPLDEMMIGLEGHIPMYMTGQISPYYFTEVQSKVFSHLLKVSSNAAMYGMAVKTAHSDGLYVFTNNKDEVSSYKNSAKEMLRSAKPLMDIYRSDRKEQFQEHIRKMWQSGNRRMIMSSLPIFTIQEDLLVKILSRHNIDDERIAEITAFRTDCRNSMSELLKKDKIRIEIVRLSKEEFDKSPVLLELSTVFIEKQIEYSYNEYIEHIEQTYAFAKEYDNCIVLDNNEPTFKNISFSIIEGKAVIVSKSKNPVIHFIIHHPKLVKAFESFVPPIR